MPTGAFRAFHTIDRGGHKCIHRANRVALRVQQYATGEVKISTRTVW